MTPTRFDPTKPAVQAKTYPFEVFSDHNDWTTSIKSSGTDPKTVLGDVSKRYLNLQGKIVNTKLGYEYSYKITDGSIYLSFGARTID